MLLAITMLAALLASCGVDPEDYVSGVNPNPEVPVDGEYEVYESDTYGIRLEYPSDFEVEGQLETDGRIRFFDETDEIIAYMPDSQHQDLETTSDYVKEVLEIGQDIKGSFMEVDYAKSTGCAVDTHENGVTTVNYIIKGENAFYRFVYKCPSEEFSTTDDEFWHYMNSIRVDDGTLAMYEKRLEEYSELLAYAEALGYVGDANRGMHAIENYMESKDERYIIEAQEAYGKIKTEVNAIIGTDVSEEEDFPTEWSVLCEEGKDVIESCEKIENAMADSDYEFAIGLARSEFNNTFGSRAGDFLYALELQIENY